MGRLQLWSDWRLLAWEALGGLMKQGVLCNWLGKQIWLFKFHPKLKTRAKLGKLVVIHQVLAVWGQLLQRLQVEFPFYMWSVHYHCPYVYSISDQNANASLSHMIPPGLSTRKCIGSFPGNSQTCVSVQVPLGVSWLCSPSLLCPASLGWGLHSLGLLCKSHLSLSSILPSSSVLMALGFSLWWASLVSLGVDVSILPPPTPTSLGPWGQDWVCVTITTSEPSTVSGLQRVYDKCLMKNSVKALVLLPTTHD